MVDFGCMFSRQSFLFFLFVPLCVFAQSGLNRSVGGVMAERELAEIIVQPKKQKYSRKNNPAVELMRKVIASKDSVDLKLNDFYRYDKYQRVTFGFNNITKRFIDSSFIRHYPALINQVEYCPQTGTDVLPLTYCETSSEHVYRKSPECEKKFVRATHSEGLSELFVTGDVVNVLLRRFFADVNICDNSICLLERYFTGPLSSAHAISFYQYFIMDTLVVDNERCIEVSFIPQNPQDFGFSGRLWIIDDGTYRLKRCLIHLPVRSSVNFISNLVLEQDFATLPSGRHTVVRDVMIAEMGALKKYHNLWVKRTTTYDNFSFDSIANDVFRRRETPREGTLADNDEQFWSVWRTEPLTCSEANMPNLVDNISNKRGFAWIMWVVRAFVENYIETSSPKKKNYVDIGPINTLISSNSVDNIRLRLSAQTTANFNPNLFLKGFIAYGFGDERLKYLAEVEYSFLKKNYSKEEFPKNSLTFSTRYDVMAPSDALLPTDKDNVFTSFKTQTIDHMSYYRQYSLRYVYEFDNHFGITTQFRLFNQTPTGSLFFRNLSGSYVSDIQQSEATVSFRYAPGENLIVTKQRRRPTNHNFSVITLLHTTGFRNFIGGDYASNYTEFSLTKRFWPSSFGRVDIFVRAGIQWNQVPFPLLIMPAANNSYIIQEHMFSMINNMEFMNDRFISLDLQWDISGKIFNRIPILKRLKWREVLGFKALYGHLTDKNNPERRPLDSRLFEFPSRYGKTISYAMSDTPYMEFNVGIHNIFRLIRIDYVRRLNYLHRPNVKRNGVRVALQFDF